MKGTLKRFSVTAWLWLAIATPAHSLILTPCDQIVQSQKGLVQFAPAYSAVNRYDLAKLPTKDRLAFIHIHGDKPLAQSGVYDIWPWPWPTNRFSCGTQIHDVSLPRLPVLRHVPSQQWSVLLPRLLLRYADANSAQQVQQWVEQQSLSGQSVRSRVWLTHWVRLDLQSEQSLDAWLEKVSQHHPPLSVDIALIRQQIRLR